MFDFLVHVHLSMFYVLVTAGTICFLWGLGILIFHRPAKSTAVAAEQKDAVEQPASVNAEGASAPSAQTKKEEGAPPSATPAKPAISPLFRSAVRVTGYLALLQAILGGVLFLMGGRPTDQLHYVYGLVVLLAVPVASVYATGKREHARRDLIILLIGALVVAAAAVRAFMTGS
jgi:uncharacterized membrane protein HdeD (DUF308 family)